MRGSGGIVATLAVAAPSDLSVASAARRRQHRHRRRHCRRRLRPPPSPPPPRCLGAPSAATIAFAAASPTHPPPALPPRPPNSHHRRAGPPPPSAAAAVVAAPPLAPTYLGRRRPPFAALTTWLRQYLRLRRPGLRRRRVARVRLVHTRPTADCGIRLHELLRLRLCRPRSCSRLAALARRARCSLPVGRLGGHHPRPSSRSVVIDRCRSRSPVPEARVVSASTTGAARHAERFRRDQRSSTRGSSSARLGRDDANDRQQFPRWRRQRRRS